jgi:Flp pilus assembly protein TadD
MRIRLTIAMASALTASCVRETRVAGAAAAPRPSTTVWDRQIHNATDAGDGDYVLKALRQRVAAEPDNIAVRLELARAYRERGYTEVALEICRLAAARFPESAEAQLGVVRSLYEMKRPQEAIAALESHARESAEYFSWMGLLRDATGAWQAGEASHRKAVAIAPAQDSLHNNLGYNLLMQKKGEEAAAEFREALRLNPASQVARNNLGMALANSSTAQAIANWQTASDPATAHSNLAAVWIEKGNYSEARKELEIALGYNRSHPAALKNMELVARLDGQPATISGSASETRWFRWKTGFKRLFVGPLDDTKAPPAKAASAPLTGEQQ